MARVDVRLIAVADSEEWDAVLPPDADIYARAGYVRAAALGGGSGLLIEASSSTARVVLPIVERLIPPWLGEHDVRDAESPYGYAGLYTTGAADDISACWAEVMRSLRDRSIVNVFLRLNPLEHPLLPESLRPDVDRTTRYVPLAGGIEVAFSGHACSTHRSQIRRAATLGITYRVTESPDRIALEGFRALYDETMARVGADSAYFFPREYYDVLAAGCGAQLALVSVDDGSGATVAQALVMAGPRYGHYHLSARSANAHNVAGHVLLDGAAAWAASRGVDALHLGGGRLPSADDPLYRFKARVGRGAAAFRTARVVVNAAAHARLGDRAAEISGHRSDWFQSYRDSRKGVQL